jgi:soluble lytic murein transglycosylase-like protein
MCALLFATAVAGGSARADIYKYVDKKGVVHFTNLPSSPEYRLYQKSNHESNYINGPATYRIGMGGDEKRYDNVIGSLCRKYEIDTALVKAVIKTESDFDPFAISSKGAQGLMQLMPDTAKLMKVGNPFDPDENIRGGARYLRYLGDTFGDLELTLAAYNAGPQRVIENKMNVPAIEETRNFIKKVKYYYNKLKNPHEG